MLEKIKLLFCIISGIAIKIYWSIKGIDSLVNLERSFSDRDIIVSLASYGRRAERVVYYTIISLFLQKKKPNRIILWLDADNWNDNNLPKRIKKLKEKGLEICFSDNQLKSYKKLVPTRINCPANIIITVDDDIFYPNNLIENLYKEHLNNPNSVIASYGKIPEADENNILLPYNSWKFVSRANGKAAMAIGYGGVLYPPNSLHRDFSNYDVFKQICPLADDIWFWVMEILNHTDRIIANSDRLTLYPIDLGQYIGHRKDSLAAVNVRNDYNDVQIRELFKKYSLGINDALQR